MSKIFSDMCSSFRPVTRLAGRMALLVLLSASPAWAEVGVVATVLNGQIIREGQPIETDAGTLVEEGDILTTEPEGLIQVQLLDGTRFMVYADSSINIDTALIGSDEKTFETLAVGVTGGIFRLLSGSSDSEAYEVTTPNASMGIRGSIGTIAFNDLVSRILITEGVWTVFENNEDGTRNESTGFTSTGLCSMIRIDGEGVAEEEPNLPEDMSAACLDGQEFYNTPYDGQSHTICEPEAQCQGNDDFSEEFTEEWLELREAYEERFGELPLGEVPEYEALKEFLDALEEASLQREPLLRGPQPEFNNLIPPQPAQPSDGNNTGEGRTIQASSESGLLGTGSSGGGRTSFSTFVPETSTSETSIIECTEETSGTELCPPPPSE